MSQADVYQNLQDERYDAIRARLDDTDLDEITAMSILQKAVTEGQGQLAQQLAEQVPDRTELPRKNHNRLRSWLHDAVHDQDRAVADAVLNIGRRWFGQDGFPQAGDVEIEDDDVELRTSMRRNKEIVQGAIENGWEDMAERLLEQSYYPKALAVETNQQLILAFLPMTDETSHDQQYRSLLGVTLRQGNIEIARQLLEQPGFEKQHVRSAYNSLINDEKLDTLKEAVDELGIELNQQANARVLKKPARNGNTELLHHVVEQGVDLTELAAKRLFDHEAFDSDDLRSFWSHLPDEFEKDSTARALIGGQYDIDRVRTLFERFDSDSVALEPDDLQQATTDEALTLLRSDLIDSPAQFVREHVFEADDPLIEPEVVDETLTTEERQELIFKGVRSRFDRELIERLERAGWVNDRQAAFFPDALNDELTEHLKQNNASLFEAVGALAIQERNSEALDWLTEHGFGAEQIPEASYYAIAPERTRFIVKLHERLDGSPDRQRRLRRAIGGQAFEVEITRYHPTQIDALIEQDFLPPEDARKALSGAIEKDREGVLKHILKQEPTVRSTHFYKALEADEAIFRRVVEEYEPGPTMMIRALNRAIEDARSDQRKLVRVAWLDESCPHAEADWSHVPGRGSNYDKPPAEFLFDHYQGAREHNYRARSNWSNHDVKVKRYPIRAVLDMLSDMGVDLLPNEEAAKRFFSELPHRLNEHDFARRLIDRNVRLERYPEAVAELVRSGYDDDEHGLLDYALQNGLDPNVCDGILLDKAADNQYIDQLDLLFEHGGRAPLIDREIVTKMAERTLDDDSGLNYKPTLKRIWADRPHHQPYQLPADLAKRWKQKEGEELLPTMTERQKKAFELM